MERYLNRALVLGLVLSLGVGTARAGRRPPKRDAHSGKAHTQSSHRTPLLHVRAIDLEARQVWVEVGGLSRPPQPNLFTFTDERDRHFVAMRARCDEPFPSGIRLCELELPVGYERHKLVSLTLHLHGLHGRLIEADPGQIASLWAAAESGRGESPTRTVPESAEVTVEGRDASAAQPQASDAGVAAVSDMAP